MTAADMALPRPADGSVEAAARVAEAILRASPGVAVLSTSREPLRAAGEHVYRVPPLAIIRPISQPATPIVFVPGSRPRREPFGGSS